MQSSITLYGVSFKQKPRVGQEAVFKKIHDERPRKLNVKLPTGYGKTITAIGSYAILKRLGICNRMLIILPTDAQREQFINNAPGDFMSVGIDDKISVVDVGYYGIKAIAKHKRDESQIYTISIQSLSNNEGKSKGLIADLLSSGRWFVTVDEYHHYGVDKSWGRAVLSLPYEHLLAMSATPDRPDNDSAFGRPDISVSYTDAVEEKAVKPLVGHAYNYMLDSIDEKGEISSFTTSELIEEVGSDSPEAIEKFRIVRKMRWSPKYVSPLVSIPLERMVANRIVTGYRLQSIIGAMCVSHAEMICRQVSEMFPDLKVDWVGTGSDGRLPKENQKIIQRFCPEKDKHGNRNPDLDVLVHVGMAGEGLDSVLVSEVIHLNKASLNNSNNQENGRAARYLPNVLGHINYDSSSDYSEYTGRSIMRAMDDLPPPDDQDGDPSDKGERDFDIPELPYEPEVHLMNVTLESIDSGELKKMADVLQEAKVSGIDYASLSNADSCEWEKIENLYRIRQRREAERFNEMSMIKQTREAVSSAVRALASRVIREIVTDGGRIDKSMVGDIYKRINAYKKNVCGEITEDIKVCRQHYACVKQLEQTIIQSGVPQWLR